MRLPQALLQCVNLMLQDEDARIVVSTEDPQQHPDDDRYRRQPGR
jgi:hypothetical protein